MNLYRDLQGNEYTTRLIQMGWELTFELYPSWWFEYIDSPDWQFRKGSSGSLTQTETQTRCDSLKHLLTP